MAKIKMHLPVGASAEFEFEKPKGWDKWSKTKQFKYAMDSNYESTSGSLCHQCAGILETDFEVLTDFVKKEFTTFYEEDDS